MLNKNRQLDCALFHVNQDINDQLAQLPKGWYQLKREGQNYHIRALNAPIHLIIDVSHTGLVAEWIFSPTNLYELR